MGSAMVGMALARRRDPGRRHVLRVPRLHAPGGAPGRAQRRQGRLRVDPRLGRCRRGRPDPPAGRAHRHAAGHPRAAGHPPGRRQRDGRGAGRPPSSTTARPRWCSPARPSRCAPTARPSTTGAAVVRRGDRAAGRPGRHGQRGLAVRRRPRRSSPRPASPPRSSACRRGIASPRRPPTTKTACCRPVLPVLSVEAGVTFGWERYADESIGIDRFGASAPGDVVHGQTGHQRRQRRGRSHRVWHRQRGNSWIVSAICTTSSGRAPGSTT